MRPLLLLALVACGHAPAVQPHADAATGDGAPDAGDPACAAVVCDDPPAAACVSNSVVRTFGLPGTCSSGTCSYEQTDRTCVGACNQARCSGAWQGFPQASPPQARYGHSAVWTGTEMILWGGADSSVDSAGDGWRYEPVHGTWHAIATANAPQARREHTAVWTGTEMIVWGGDAITQGDPYSDGARYDPVADTWTSLPTAGAPAPRFAHSAVWTGKAMIVWGGAVSSVDSLGDGASFDPATNTWTPISSTGAPDSRRDHAAVWTGSEMLVWGGAAISAGDPAADVHAYNPTTDTWRLVTTTHAPAARFGQVAVWTGGELIGWGGASSSTSSFDDGARLDLVTGTWTPLPATTAGARRDASAVWTGTAMLMWGGCTILDGGGVYGTGASYALFH